MDELTFYLAAPCFSTAERTWNVDMLTALTNYCDGMGFNFYLPQAHVQESWSSEKIREELVRGLVDSAGIIANLDGPGGDDGTCWEMGFVSGMNAMAMGLGRLKMGRSIFWYRTDFRHGGDSLDNVNLMMAHSGKKVGLEYGTSVPGVARAIQEALVRVHGATRPAPLFSTQAPNCS